MWQPKVILFFNVLVWQKNERGRSYYITLSSETILHLQKYVFNSTLSAVGNLLSTRYLYRFIYFHRTYLYFCIYFRLLRDLIISIMISNVHQIVCMYRVHNISMIFKETCHLHCIISLLWCSAGVGHHHIMMLQNKTFYLKALPFCSRKGNDWFNTS